jgi:hypothetical protein
LPVRITNPTLNNKSAKNIIDRLLKFLLLKIKATGVVNINAIAAISENSDDFSGVIL